MKTWKYYNNAMIPTTTPQEPADEEALNDSEFWKENKNAFFARWSSDFDCKKETNWWYVIKDTPFDIAALKSNRRYKINKGIKYFDVKLINPCDYREDLYRVQTAAFSAYPKKYRPTVDKEAFLSGIDGWKDYTVFGAFYRETGELVGYALLTTWRENFLDLSVLKSNPEYEKLQINAALVAKIMAHFALFLTNGGIICDGARSISHETNFQDYLEYYFGFRKAYCRLHIRYNPKIKWLIGFLYPVRGLLKKLDGIGIVHKVNAVLKMEEICRCGEQDQ